jgi:hypothetical protein
MVIIQFPSYETDISEINENNPNQSKNNSKKILHDDPHSGLVF